VKNLLITKSKAVCVFAEAVNYTVVLASPLLLLLLLLTQSLAVHRVLFTIAQNTITPL